MWLDLRALGLFRSFLGLASLVEVYELAAHQAFLKEQGLCPSPEKGAMADLFMAARAPEMTAILLALNALAALSFLVGYSTRLATWASWLFAMSQHHRLSNCVSYAGDRLRCQLLFWCLFQPVGQVWSVDAYLRELETKEMRDEKDKQRRSTLAPASAFLLLLQMASMYEYTASVKVGDSWVSGEAVLQTLRLSQYAREPVAGLVAMCPLLCRFFTHATLYVERYGWLLAFLPCSRLVAVLSFLALHLGLHLSLRVGSFQLFVLSAWLVALPGWLLDHLEAWLHRRWPASRRLLVTSHVPPKLWRATALNLVGFGLMFLAVSEGCAARGERCGLGLVDLGAKPLLAKLDLLQRYPMFSPDAPRRSLRVQLYGLLASPACDVKVEETWACPTVELWRGSPSLEASRAVPWGNLSAPAPQALDFASNRWRKLAEQKETSRAIGGDLDLAGSRAKHAETAIKRSL